MILRFYAKEDQLVHVPGFHPLPGQFHEFVGRRFDFDKKSWPATSEPAQFDSESEPGRRLVALVRRDACLWPADEATAVACGVQFVAIEIKDGMAAMKTKASAGQNPPPVSSPASPSA